MIRTRTEARIAFVELARPEKKNALTAQMYAQLAAALAAAQADGQVRAILLHGTPECFCAGNDVADFLDAPPLAEGAPALDFFRAMLALDKPVVAAVGGPAVGIGTTMLLHCDLVYAADNARFQLPFVPLGIAPEFGSTLLLPLLAGYQRAAELLLLGKPFDAARAREVGLVSEVVPAAELLARAGEAAATLARLPPGSLRATKRLLRKRYAAALDDAIAEEVRVFGERLASAEAKEAVSAFLEKRKPDFSRF